LTVAAAVSLSGAGCGKHPVALVNGHRIDEADFIKRLKQEQGKPVLMSMIDEILVADAFERAGLKVDPAEIDKRIKELQDRFPNHDEFVKWLDGQGLTEEDVRGKIELMYKVEKLCTKDVKGYTEADLKKFFEEHRKERYDKPLRVTISDILVNTKAEADKVYALAKQKDASFADLARQYSMSATRSAGGRWPERPVDQIFPKELRKPAATLPVGSISKPIEIRLIEGEPSQWIIIKVDERKASEKAKFENVRKQVEEDYKQSKAKSISSLLNELREKAQVNIYDVEFQDLLELYGTSTKLPTFGPGGTQQGGTSPAPSGSQPPTRGESSPKSQNTQ